MTVTTKSKSWPMKIGGVFLLISLSAAIHANEPSSSRPMAEMEGGCENFAMPLKTEMALWEKSELRVQGAQDDRSTTTLPSGKKINLGLYPQKKVNLPVKPEKDFTPKGDLAFAGLATMEVKNDGLYRVALGSKVWLDLIEASVDDSSAKIVSPVKFEMQTGCKKIFKAVEYNLKGGKKYFLQISSSREPTIQVLTSFVK